ncbi:hypothetical protein EJB05_49463, partial [Eragrostis curvula]
MATTNPSAVAIKAASEGNLRLLKKVAKEMDLREAKDSNGANTLYFAAAGGHLEPNRVFLSVYSPLLMACEARCSLECVKLLVEAGADLNFIMPYGSSPLIAATKEGLTDIVRFLLEAGADPNICDDFGENPIIYAGRDGRRDLVEILFPHTKPVTYVPNWSVDGIICTMKDAPTIAMGPGVGADMKIRGNEAFAKGDYSGAIYFYGLNYKGSAHAFAEALKLDPASDEIKAALRQCTSLIFPSNAISQEATEALSCAARSDEQKNP